METKLNIPDQRIASILCNAFEGGSNYWVYIAQKIAPPEGQNKPVLDAGMDNPRVWPRCDWPLTGGAIIISDREEELEGNEPIKHYRLDREAIERGLQVIAEKYPQHFADMLPDGSDDATTGDVFLQCCLFGELVYG